MSLRPLPRLRPVDLRRALMAALVGVTTLAVLGGTLGFAQAQGRAGPEALPETFGVPWPKVGDRGSYAHERINVSSGAAVWDESPWFDFEWRPDRRGADGHGREQTAQALRLVRHRTPAWNEDALENVSFILEWVSSHGTANFTFRLDPGSRGLVSYAVDRATASSHPSHAPTGGQVRYDENLTLERFVRPAGAQPLFLCGLTNPFQGAEIPLGVPVTLAQRCDLFAYPAWPPPLPFAAARAPPLLVPLGTGSAGGHEALVFGLAAREQGATSDLRVWFARDVPYPLRLEVQVPGRAGVWDVIRLAAYERGAGPDVARDADAGPDAAPLSPRPRTPWVLDERGVDHPFPLSQAFLAQRDDPASDELRRYLAENPQAFVQRAAYAETHPRGLVVREWQFAVTDGEGALSFCPNEFTPVVDDPDGDGPAPGRELHEAAWVNLGRSCDDYARSYLAPGEVPDSFPSLLSLMDRYAAMAGAGATAPNAWGFDFSCAPRTYPCQLDRFVLTVGRDRHEERWAGVPPALPGMPQSLRHERTTLEVDSAGWSRSLRSQAATTTESSGAPPPGPVPENERGVRAVSAASVVRPWSLPEGGYAVGAGLLALLAGLAYLAWPNVKSLLALPLFSRVEGPRVLELPARERLAGLVRAQPGVHFEELVRRSGFGRGAAQHHLDRLVRAGVVWVDRGPGYTCYTAAGAVDRRVAAAGPHLKADGARRLVDAALQRPGLSASAAAAQAGLTRQAAHQHLGRLAEAGVLRLARVGRRVNVEPTSLARALRDHGWVGGA